MKKIKKALQRLSKIRSCIEKCDWKGINFPTGLKEQKMFETNNKTITLYVFFLASNGGLEKIRPAYISEHNSEHKHLVIFEVITDGEKWYYIAV